MENSTILNRFNQIINSIRHIHTEHTISSPYSRQSLPTFKQIQHQYKSSLLDSRPTHSQFDSTPTQSHSTQPKSRFTTTLNPGYFQPDSTKSTHSNTIYKKWTRLMAHSAQTQSNTSYTTTLSNTFYTSNIQTHSYTFKHIQTQTQFVTHSTQTKPDSNTSTTNTQFPSHSTQNEPDSNTSTTYTHSNTF